MARPQRYKYTEKFISVKGEGLWTGVPMAFLRLSHCPVGGADGICKNWDGMKFTCDTGAAYRAQAGGPRSVEWHGYDEVNGVTNAAPIWAWVHVEGQQHLVMTGGEPLIYDIEPLLLDGMGPQDKLHIETSGTEDQGTLIEAYHDRIWLTVSPKEGWLPAITALANEIKILVHSHTTKGSILELLKQMDCPSDFEDTGGNVLLQPIEGPDWALATRRAYEIAVSEPQRFRVSAQVHKMLNVR